MLKNIPWWKPDAWFFGDFYIEWDDSVDWYLVSQSQNLTERTIAEVDGVIKLLWLQWWESILDCPCWYGRHSIELSQRGFSVVWSDINPTHLSKALIDSNQYNIANTLRFQEESMLDIKYNQEFDTIINMFYSFGFFSTEDENFKVLKNFYKWLKLWWKFLMHTDVNIPFIEAWQYKHHETRVLQNGNLLEIQDYYNKQTKRIDGIWKIKNTNGELLDMKEYSVRVYTKDEFIDLCKLAGFQSCEAYWNWSGEAYWKIVTDDMIIIAQK